ncbi:hypothetical protein MATL_G00134650 [Megalops atlanticus]|uniref:Uncharacterized protein n=1 Tax=Megalops atlanticus TaxID=7932 RepID=A0A9D3T7I7_MEGAT|nr:hypothetical protein MATL_G00134650 [Megalops atlanticus]
MSGRNYTITLSANFLPDLSSSLFVRVLTISLLPVYIFFLAAGAFCRSSVSYDRWLPSFPEMRPLTYAL